MPVGELDSMIFDVRSDVTKEDNDEMAKDTEDKQVAGKKEIKNTRDIKGTGTRDKTGADTRDKKKTDTTNDKVVITMVLFRSISSNNSKEGFDV